MDHLQVEEGSPAGLQQSSPSLVGVSKSKLFLLVAFVVFASVILFFPFAHSFAVSRGEGQLRPAKYLVLNDNDRKKSQLPFGSVCSTLPFGQCGGKEFAGEECCPTNFDCVAENEYYSRCKETELCPVLAEGQCGGKDWVGETCCPEGYECAADNEFFSGCKLRGVNANVRCPNEAHSQCGGKGFEGQSCCPDGFECKADNEWFSGCKPECATVPFGQCGGKYWKGDTCCPRSYECTVHNELFSGCALAKPILATATDLTHLTNSPQRRWKPGHHVNRRYDPSCPNRRFDKCGGKDFAGETCCPEAFECVDVSLLEGRYCMESGRPF